jgi:RNA polymerase sigma-70 factor (ECF subfamily)
MEGPDETSSPERAGWFATTHWSVVLAARDGESTTSRKALERLCCLYWPPIYAFLRREGHRPADAEDLTQAFFAHLFEKSFLAHLQHQEGRFRSFLLTFLKHFLSDQRDKADAQKRGGGKALLSLDQMAEEERSGMEPPGQWTAEQVFERRWAQALMEQAVERLRREYVANGKEPLFELLKDVQPGERGTLTYADIGVRLGLTEQAVKNAIHRLRRRHREILREEIAQTLTDPSKIEEEIQHLMAVLAG